MFRERVLWTRDVNLVLDANKEGISALYLHFSQQNKCGKMSMTDAKRLMSMTRVQLSEKDAQTCYALSLMTCQNIVKSGYLQVDHISLLEFYEMIGRCADVFQHEADKPLHEKINFVLDEWLAIVGYERREPQYYEVREFENNDDYHAPIMKTAKV